MASAPSPPIRVGRFPGSRYLLAVGVSGRSRRRTGGAGTENHGIDERVPPRALLLPPCPGPRHPRGSAGPVCALRPGRAGRASRPRRPPRDRPGNRGSGPDPRPAAGLLDRGRRRVRALTRRLRAGRDGRGARPPRAPGADRPPARWGAGDRRGRGGLGRGAAAGPDRAVPGPRPTPRRGRGGLARRLRLVARRPGPDRRRRRRLADAAVRRAGDRAAAGRPLERALPRRDPPDDPAARERSRGGADRPGGDARGGRVGPVRGGRRGVRPRSVPRAAGGAVVPDRGGRGDAVLRAALRPAGAPWPRRPTRPGSWS